MTKLRFPLAILILSVPLILQAQARPGCALKPSSLAQMRRCYRPLLVFSPSSKDPRLNKQQSMLDEAADDMMDRFVLFLPLLTQKGNYQPPLDTPYALVSSKEMSSIRNRFQIPESQFTVLLLGEDGTVKLRSTEPISVERLNRLIDSMPDRKAEMQRPHAN